MLQIILLMCITEQEIRFSCKGVNKSVVWKHISIVGMQLGPFYALNQSTRVPPNFDVGQQIFVNLHIYMRTPALVCDQTETGLIRG